MPALEFSIAFQNANTEIALSDTGDYLGIGTVAKTDIKVTYPPITGITPVNVDLYDENIASIGDNYIIIPATHALGDLIDGVYGFTLEAYDVNPTLLASLTQYFVNDYNIRAARRTAVQNIIDKTCSCDGGLDKLCEVNMLLDSAHEMAANGEWQRAQCVIEYIQSIINSLSCDC